MYTDKQYEALSSELQDTYTQLKDTDTYRKKWGDE